MTQVKRIVIAGGSGFLGTPLAAGLAAQGHDVRVLTRSLRDGATARDERTGATRVGWDPALPGTWMTVVDGAAAVVNLAGASLADGRWTPARKAELRDSRIVPTRMLASAIRAATVPPAVLISTSGSGYYGPCGDEAKTEADPAGNDFVGVLCKDWEAAAQEAGGRTRVVTMRAGVVLERSGGALARMIPPFKMFLGGPMGSGRQYMPWIHRVDWLAMVRWIASRDDVNGPINVVAPQAVTNREFSTALGRALHRPAVMPIPATAMRVLYGEMAQALLLTGQRVVPAKAQQLGFTWSFPDLASALATISPGLQELR